MVTETKKLELIGERILYFTESKTQEDTVKRLVRQGRLNFDNFKMQKWKTQAN